MTTPNTPTPETDADKIRRLESERNQLITAAENAIPMAEWPAEKTVDNWAWQIRNLGDDRRCCYRQKHALNLEVKAIETQRDELQREVARLQNIIGSQVETQVGAHFSTLHNSVPTSVITTAEIKELRGQVERLKAKYETPVKDEQVQALGRFIAQVLHRRTNGMLTDGDSKEAEDAYNDLKASYMKFRTTERSFEEASIRTVAEWVSLQIATAYRQSQAQLKQAESDRDEAWKQRDELMTFECQLGALKISYGFLEEKLTAAHTRVKELEEALNGLLARYVSLVESGDAGNWNAEEESQVIAARAALTQSRREAKGGN